MKSLMICLLSFLLLSSYSYSQSKDWNEFEDLIHRQYKPNEARMWLLKKLNKSILKNNIYDVNRCFNSFILTTSAMEEQGRQRFFFQLDSLSRALPKHQKCITQVTLMSQLLSNRWLSYRMMTKPVIVGKDTILLASQNDLVTFIYDRLKLIEDDRKGLEKIELPSSFTYFSSKDLVLPTAFDFVSYKLIQLYSSHQIARWVEHDTGIDIKEDWIVNPDFFIELNIDKTSITNRTMKLYQDLEKLNFDRTSVLSQFHYLRLKHLSIHFTSERMQKVFQNAFTFYNDSPLRSKFILEVARFKYKDGLNYHFQTNPNYEHLISEAYELLKSEKKKFPKSNVINQIDEFLLVMKKPELEINNLNHIYPKSSVPLKIAYRNLDGVDVYVLREKTRQTNNGYELFQSLKSKNYSEVLKRTLILPNKGLLQMRTKEMLLPEIAVPGDYVILILPKGKSWTSLNVGKNNWGSVTASYSRFTVTEITVAIQSSLEGTKLVVTDYNSGEPIKNAKVDIFYSRFTEILEGIPVKRGSTDENGFFNTSLKNYQNYTCRVRYNDSEILVGDYNSNYENNPSNHSAAIFTDRSIYRPGQKLYYKSIEYKGSTVDNEFDVVENNSLTVKLYDANYQLIATHEKQANQFGSIAGVFDLPSAGLLGRYSIKVYDKNGSYLNELSFRVEEYKRPTFSVSMEAPKDVVKLDDSVSVTGNVNAFAGFPLSGVNVRYSVYREPSYFWWYRPMGYSGESELMESGEIKTDEQGQFEVEFFASSKSKLNQGQFNYNVKVDVTDLSGETQSTAIDIRVSETGLFLNYNGPSSYIYGSIASMEINLQNAFGENQPQEEGKITLYRKKEQKRFLSRIWQETEYSDVDSLLWGKLFPYRKLTNDNFLSEGISSDKNYLKVKEISFTTADSIDLKKLFSGLKTGEYKMEAFVIKNEHKVSMVQQLDFINDDDEAYRKAVPLWVQKSQMSAKVGEEVAVRFGSGFAESNALIEIYSGKDLMSSEWHALRGTNKIKLTIQEENRGGISILILLIKNGVRYYENVNIDVPFNNKRLNVETMVFRDKLYPGQYEEWSFKISDHSGKHIETEVLASMYDASLDEFAPHSFSLWPYYSRYPYFKQAGMNNQVRVSSNVYGDWRHYYNYRLLNTNQSVLYGGPSASYNDFKMSAAGGTRMRNDARGGAIEEYALEESESVMAAEEPMSLDDGSVSERKKESDAVKKTVSRNKQRPTTSQIRKNFNETAFFYPHLKTNDKGEVIVSFKLPESLTKWNFQAFAHTKDMRIGNLDMTAIAQKDLMIAANAPRFYRRGDIAIFSSRLTNLSENNLDVDVELTFFNPTNEKIVRLTGSKKNRKSIKVNAGGNSVVEWEIDLADAPDLIAYKIIAKTKGFSDGEQKMIPVLSNRQFVTEAYPFVAVGKGIHQFSFQRFKENQSTTLSHHRFSLEYTANPIWNVVLALPYMTDYPYECSEQVFTRFFANTLAAQVIGAKPELQKTLEIWKKQSPEVFLSELNKNEELRGLLLTETPWVVEAQSEEEQRNRVIQLFDMNNLKDNLDGSLSLLKRKQNSDGGFGWFGGNRSNLYITQHIVAGFGYLKQLGVSFDTSTEKMIYKALGFISNEYYKSYQRMTKKEQKNLTISRMALHWLYASSFFEVENNKKMEEMLQKYDRSLQNKWMMFGLQEQSLAGIYFKRMGNMEMANLILSSLQDRTKFIKNRGRFFPENRGGYYWYGDKIGTHAMLLTFFSEMDVKQQEIEELRLWLLLNKRTNHWGHTKNTAMATYAMLLTGSDFTSDNTLPRITIGSEEIVGDNSQRHGTGKIPFLGYFKKSWSQKEVNKDLGDLSIEKTTSTPSYGSMYWQYFEDIDKIEESANPDIDVKRKYELVVAGQKGKEYKKSEIFNIGDRIRITLTFETQNDLEYVHLKDLRPSGFEPLESLSRHHWDQGLWYYQSPKDASMNFFIDRLPRGSYTLSYEVFATAQGRFSAGNTTIQCMYAPEMTGHSKGEVIVVKK
jgi:uncharacterized protein YfaS (alpha-2-macroglobulin family)